jgi:WD40 repeat protein
MILSLSNRFEPRLAFGDPNAGTVTIWDLAANTKIRTLKVVDPNDPPAAPLSDVNMSPDGQTVVTLKTDAVVETWDVLTGQKLLTLPGPAAADGAAMYFSPDGKLLIITDCTGTAVVRDAASGAEIQRFSQVGVCVQGVAFSPDKKLIALTSNNRQTTIRDLETGQVVLTLPGGGSVEFTPDGTRVIIGREFTALTHSTINVFLVRLTDLVALAKTRVTRGLTSAECQQYLHVDECPAGN